MGFKVGDKVKVVGYQKGCDMDKFLGKVFKIREAREDEWYHLEGNIYTWRPDWLEPVLYNNPLNKKLYPNYIEENGYLVPPISTTKKTYLKAGEKVDINVGYFTAEKTGWYNEKWEYLGE